MSMAFVFKTFPKQILLMIVDMMARSVGQKHLDEAAKIRSEIEAMKDLGPGNVKVWTINWALHVACYRYLYDIMN